MNRLMHPIGPGGISHFFKAFLAHVIHAGCWSSYTKALMHSGLLADASYLSLLALHALLFLISIFLELVFFSLYLTQLETFDFHDLLGWMEEQILTILCCKYYITTSPTWWSGNFWEMVENSAWFKSEMCRFKESSSTSFQLRCEFYSSHRL